jgi:hypothetical protein
MYCLDGVVPSLAFFLHVKILGRSKESLGHINFVAAIFYFGVALMMKCPHKHISSKCWLLQPQKVVQTTLQIEGCASSYPTGCMHQEHNVLHNNMFHIPEVKFSVECQCVCSILRVSYM